MLSIRKKTTNFAPRIWSGLCPLDGKEQLY